MSPATLFSDAHKPPHRSLAPSRHSSHLTTWARFLAVHLPAFRLERLGYQADEIAVVIAEERNAMRLIALTPAAVECGLFAGMTVSQARSLVPDVTVELHEALAEAQDRGEMLRAFEALSDQIHPLGPDDLVLEVSRSAHVLGGEAKLMQRTREVADLLGHAVKLALSDDPLGALALAHVDEGIVVSGQMAQSLARLPIRALSEPLVPELRRIGIETLGAFASLDAASVSGRFGAEGLRVHRIARGERVAVSEGALAWAPDRLPSVRIAMAGAVTSLQIGFVLPGVLRQLADALADRGLAVVQLRLGLHLERGNPVTFGVRVGRPTRSVEVLQRLVKARLASVLIDAPVDELVIEVREAVTEQGWQPGLTDRSQANEPLPDLLARLKDALGEPAVFAAEPADTWNPERSWKAVGFPLMPTPRAPSAPPDDPVSLQERWEDSLVWSRPTQILERPKALDVRLENGIPVAILGGQGWLQVSSALGPEELSGDWWDPTRAWQRSYWQLRLGDRRAWVFQDEANWFLHGWF